MKNRESGLDIYRIAAMVMITILHVNNQHFGLLRNFLPSGQYIAGWAIEYLCFCGVNCFALLSGCLMGEQKWHYDGKWLEKCAGLWLKLLIWGVALYCAVNSVKGAWSWESFKINLCPPFGNWWYISAYFGFLLFLPVLNNFISSAKPAAMLRISLLLFLFFSILPIMMESGGSMGLGEGYSALWLIVCYIWGAALKSFMPQIMQIKHIGAYSAILALVCGVFPLFFHLYSGVENPARFMNYLSPLCVLEAAALLILCCRIKIRNDFAVKIITFLSVNSLGIYLFQCHLQIWYAFVERKNPPVLAAKELFWRVPATVLALFAAGIICNVIIDKLWLWCRFDKFIRRCCQR